MKLPTILFAILAIMVIFIARTTQVDFDKEAGSPGPDCCKRKCVNVMKDRFNCGMCGYKYKYSEICCKGQFINASFDKRNCGGYHKKCKKGEFCVYGMCNYA
ncbi:hypothetical protein Gotur_025911 [Gossypium turneri]